MADVEWAEGDMSPATNEKYKPMLVAIRKGTTAKNKGRWAVLESFESDQTGRDLAYRLKEKNPDFEFVSRKNGNEVTVFARLREGVTK